MTAENQASAIRTVGTCTEDDLTAAIQVHTDFRSIGWNVARVLGAILLLYGLLGAFGGEVIRGGVLVLVGLFWLFGLKSYCSWWTKRIFCKTPLFGVEMESLITEDSVFFSHELGKSEMYWGAFVKWKEGPRTFLLYTSDALFHIWPKRFFRSQDDIEHFRVLLSKKIPPRK